MRPIDADKIVYSWQIDADGQEHDGVTLQSIIAKMPTIEPERRKGKWIAHPGGKFVGFPYMHYECDQCRDFEPEERNFCPNCGSQMERGGET